jgi:hypothetical protein
MIMLKILTPVLAQHSNVKISKQTYKQLCNEVVKAVAMKNTAFLVGCDGVC